MQRRMKRSMHDVLMGGGVKAKSGSAAKMPQWKERRISGDERVHALRRVDPDTARSPKVAAFDLDGTLISRPSRSRVVQSANDYSLRPNVVEKIRLLHRAGYRLVVLSNQASIAEKPRGPQAQKIKQLINNVVSAIGVPIDAYCAVLPDGKDEPKKSFECTPSCRKPSTGMWHLLRQDMASIDNLLEPEKSTSFFVGDAAGRSGDHSNCDIVFAQHLDLAFYTPESFFANAELPPPYYSATSPQLADVDGQNDQQDLPEVSKEEVKPADYHKNLSKVQRTSIEDEG